jgi:hypothetical protein
MRLNQQGKNHDLLVLVTKKQEERIHRIIENMNAIIQLIKMMVDFNPALIAAQLQHRQLSIDLLDTLQMTEMHRSIEEVAGAWGYVLTAEHSSNFFQFHALGILIMLHMPCINKDQMLTTLGSRYRNTYNEYGSCTRYQNNLFQ